MKKYLSVVFVAMLIALVPSVSAEPSASATRNIENQNLAAGGSTNVTVTVINSVSQALSLMEILPSGWNLTRVSDDASAFKNSTNEWLWFDVGAGVTKTVIYRLDVPSDAAPGAYSINGNISNSNGTIADVSGEKLISIAGDVPPVLTTITVSPPTATLAAGGTQQFTATALDQNNTPMAGVNISWTVSNFTVGNVTPVSAITGPDGNASTTFTASVPGTAVVNATNGSITGSASVDVSSVPPQLASIIVSPSTVSLTSGGTQQFNATALDQNNNPMPGINISWTVSNFTVGNVTPVSAITGSDGNASAVFTASAAGTAVINATNGSVTGSADVTVTAPPLLPVLTTISVLPPTAALNVGGTQQFTATALDQNNTPMAGINISWSISNSSVGNVTPLSAVTDANGSASTTFTALAPGTAVVNATNGSVTGSANVTVSPVPLQLFNISGFKINGTNGNGTGIPGWKITLLNNATGAEIANTTTDIMGFYMFSNLPNGTYDVTEEMRTGWTNISPMLQTVTISGTAVMNVDFTNALVSPTTGSISGTKFNDQNDNGTRDAGEPGLGNWTIMLIKPDGSNVTATTNADGSYTFSNLSSGNYTVGEVLQPGWMQTFPPSPGTTNVSLPPGGNIVGVDFGNHKIQLPETFGISGFKLNGATGAGIQGWNITLANGTMQTNTLTDATGFYQFTGLANGTYNVTEETRAGFTPSGPTSRDVTVAGKDVTNINFTNTPIISPATGSISGTKFNDSNGNGARDEKEQGLPGWTIVLTEPDGSVVNTTTDADGSYSFADLPAGNYTVAEILQPDWEQTAPPTGTYAVTLAAGQVATGLDFGNKQVQLVPPVPKLGSISGFKINSADGSGLSSWKIELKGIDAETRHIRSETITDGTGFYKFDNLPAGRYLVMEKHKKGFVPASSPVKVLVLTAGQDSVNNNFTNRPIRSLIK